MCIVFIKLYECIAGPEVPPANLRLSLYQPNAGLSIEWDKLSCEDTNAYILSYHVGICPSNNGLNCSGRLSKYILIL